MVRGRHLVDIETGSGDTQDADPDGEYPFYVRSDTPLRSDSWQFDAPAVLTAGDGAGVAKVFHLVEGRFMAHQRVYVLTNFRRVLPTFFYYQFSANFWAMALDGSAKSTVDSVRRWMIADMPFAVPPMNEQRAIADFLDRETAQIDALIAKQERLIETLRERRVSAVGEAAAAIGGDLVPVKRLFVPSDVTAQGSEDVLSVYREYGVVPKSSRDGNHNRTPVDVSRYLVVHPGDLVVNKMKAWQGSLGISRHSGIVSGDYEVARPRNESALADYLHLFLRSPRMISQYASRSTGIRPSQWRLYWDQLGALEVRIPSRRRQQEFVDELTTTLARIEALIAKAERFIELSRERRAALITAAVTGQIDVAARD